MIYHILDEKVLVPLGDVFTVEEMILLVENTEHYYCIHEW